MEGTQPRLPVYEVFFGAKEMVLPHPALFAPFVGIPSARSFQNLIQPGTLQERHKWLQGTAAANITYPTILTDNLPSLCCSLLMNQHWTMNPQAPSPSLIPLLP